MKVFLGFAGVLVVAISLLLAVAALLDHTSKKRELDLTFTGHVIDAYQLESGLYRIIVEDSIGPITIDRVRTELYQFVEIGDTIIKKMGDPNCLVQNQPLHKHHVFEMYGHNRTK